MFVIALAYHQHDVRHTIAATVHLDLIARSLQLVYLCISQAIGIKTESQAINGDIEICFVLLIQFVLHLSDGFAGKEPAHRQFIVPGLRIRTIQTPGREQSHHQLGNSIDRLVNLRQDDPLTHAFGNGSDSSPEEMTSHQ